MTFAKHRTAFLTAVAIVPLIAGALSGQAGAAEPTYQFDIPAESLSNALTDYSQTSAQQIFFTDNVTKDRKSSGLHGRYTAAEALQQLLAGTDLKMETNSAGVLMVQPKNAQAASNDGAASSAETVERVVVTGTNIRGVNPDGSALQTFTQNDIRQTGATTTEEFFQRLPSNFSGFQANAPGALAGNGPSSLSSVSGINGLNLRGLGLGTTLVLVNGHPLAPAALGVTPDISLIPLTDLGRVEVMTDGASAIYGSQAIGGVVNFVMRTGFDGLETDIGGGTVTSGSHTAFNAQQVLGRDWGSGSALLSIGYADQSPLMAADRSFAAPAGNYMLIPGSTRANVFFNARQQITPDISIFGDALYSTAHTRVDQVNAVLTPPFQEHLTSKNAIFTGTVGGDISLPMDWNFEASANYSGAPESQTGTFNSPAAIGDRSSVLDVSGKLDGDLLSLPAGSAKFAVGGGMTSEHYQSRTLNTNGLTTYQNLSRDTKYAFGELYLPLVDPKLGMPGVEKLEASLAARYTHYSDFGDNVSPRFSISWTPISSIKARASYSDSFRAPFLRQLDASNDIWELFSASLLPAVQSYLNVPTTSAILFTNGSNANIGPEKAITRSAGIDFEPEIWPGVKFSATVFDIDYSNKIAAPNSSLAFSSPTRVPYLYNTSPTLAQVTDILKGSSIFVSPATLNTSSAAAVLAETSVIMDLRTRNLAATKEAGLDLEASYSFDAFNLGSQATVLFQDTSQASPGGAFISNLNIVGAPVKYRDRSWLGYSQGPWTGQISANLVGSYSDPYTAPASHVNTWATFDLAGSYRFEDTDGPAKGLQVQLSIQNLFDADPPYVAVSKSQGITVPVGYDPANANALGRFISVQLKKEW